jgi:hypothetical protein
MMSHACSLDEISPGCDAAVRRIFFDSVRAACAAVGIREGSQVRCERSREESLVLRVDGRIVQFALSWSRFVQIDCATEGC